MLNVLKVRAICYSAMCSSIRAEPCLKHKIKELQLYHTSNADQVIFYKVSHSSLQIFEGRRQQKINSEKLPSKPHFLIYLSCTCFKSTTHIHFEDSIIIKLATHYRTRNRVLQTE